VTRNDALDCIAREGVFMVSPEHAEEVAKFVDLYPQYLTEAKVRLKYRGVPVIITIRSHFFKIIVCVNFDF
jgi:hypothetical protein